MTSTAAATRRQSFGLAVSRRTSKSLSAKRPTSSSPKAATMIDALSQTSRSDMAGSSGIESVTARQENRPSHGRPISRARPVRRKHVLIAVGQHKPRMRNHDLLIEAE